MIKLKNSLADKVIFVVITIFLTLNIILFSGITILTKKTFFNLEKEKAHLIAKNYAPFLSMAIYLGLEEKTKNILDHILKNCSVVKVKITHKDHKEIQKSKNFKGDTIKVSSPILDPNTHKEMGKLELFYSTYHYKEFIKSYFVVLAIIFIFIMVALAGLYKYIKKLLYPLKNLSSQLKNFSPDKKLNIPYKDSDDEIGLISKAISISNDKTIEYSKNLQSMAQTLIDINKNLEQKVQEELEQIREKDKQLIQQSRLAQMGEMINMIAHQWRQPLSAISSTTNDLLFKNMMQESLDKEYLEKELQLISQYSQHLSTTIDDFRNFYKKNKDKERVYIKSLIDETLNIVKISLEHHNINIHTNIYCNPMINTYPNELKQVILNLIKNSQDALIDKNIQNPLIKIETVCENSSVKIVIKDNAGGIPENILPKIFEPYFSTKLEKDGTGLGLYMSKTIIEEHCDGKIYAKNEDDGAIFTIELKKDIQEDLND